MNRELLQQALEALEEYEYARTDKAMRLGHAAITALRAAIAQPAISIEASKTFPAVYLHYARKKPELRRLDFSGRPNSAERAAGWLTVKYEVSQSGQEEAIAQPERPLVRPLQWSEEREPCESIRYNHVVAESALGLISIEWKGWKDYDSFCVHLDGDYIDTAPDLHGAKAIAVAHLQALVLKLVHDSSAIAQPASTLECTRSHPHENMDELCKLRTIIARLENEKALAQPVQPATSERVPYFAERLKDFLCDRVENAGGAEGLTLFMTKLGRSGPYQLYDVEALALWTNLGIALGQLAQQVPPKEIK